MATTTPDGISYPTNADAQKTLEQRIQDTATSVQTAIFHNTTAIVNSSSARDARFPSPAQGDSVWRSDKGWEERYFAEFNSSTNTGGATPAGWYPVGGVMPSARLTCNSNQSTSGTAGTFTKYLFNLVQYDTAAMSTPNANSLTAPVAGIYLVNTHMNFSTGTSSVFVTVQIRKNNAIINDTYFEDLTPGQSGQYPWTQMHTTIDLAAGDTVSVWVGSTNTASVTLNVPLRNSLDMTYIGPKR